MSSRLTSESRMYADKARDLNRQVSLIGSLNDLQSEGKKIEFSLNFLGNAVVARWSFRAATFLQIMPKLGVALDPCPPNNTGFCPLAFYMSSLYCLHLKFVLKIHDLCISCQFFFIISISLSSVF